MGIEGIVSGKGQPLTGGNVCLYESDGTEVGCAAIGASGSYAFANLAADAYVLKFESPGFPTQYSGGVSEFAAAAPVAVEWEEVAAFEAELRGPSGIGGVVRDAQTGEAIAAGQACAVTGSTSVCAPIQGGEYSIPLAPGVYEVRFEAEGHQTQFWDGVLIRSEATPVTRRRSRGHRGRCRTRPGRIDCGPGHRGGRRHRSRRRRNLRLGRRRRRMQRLPRRRNL